MVVDRAYVPQYDLENTTAYHLVVIPYPENSRDRQDRDTWVGEFRPQIVLARRIEPTDYRRDEVMRFFHQQLDRLHEPLPNMPEAKLIAIEDIALNSPDILIQAGLMEFVATPVYSIEIEPER